MLLKLFTWCQFHQGSTWSFYLHRSQKRKKDTKVVSLFCSFGICVCKSRSWNVVGIIHQFAQTLNRFHSYLFDCCCCCCDSRRNWPKKSKMKIVHLVKRSLFCCLLIVITKGQLHEEWVWNKGPFKYYVLLDTGRARVTQCHTNCF